LIGFEHCPKDSETHKPSVQAGPPEVQSTSHNFPPVPPNPCLHRKIISEFYNATAPSKFEEAGCAVCGSLTLRSELSELSSLDIDLSVLNAAG
jgi:hypothetical protein